MPELKSISPVSGSFRDPAGFLYRSQGRLLRQVNPVGEADYQLLMDSGLYQALVNKGWLIRHKEIGLDSAADEQAIRVLKPALIPFISYPYEWSFSQLKDAALLTLRIQMAALEKGLSLKDASSYNVQFLDGRPVFIDTLSFEPYKEGLPWVAYGQYCRHFLAPLALADMVDIGLLKLLRANIDGLDLGLTSKLLPKKTLLKPAILSHLHLHAKSQKKYAETDPAQAKKATSRPLSKKAMLGLVDNLISTTLNLGWKPEGTEWADYYNMDSYTDSGEAHKLKVVEELIGRVGPRSAIDLGANTGRYSRLASRAGAVTVASDIDPAAVEKNYLAVKASEEKNLLPLVMDLANPSPSLGWAGEERMSLDGRGPLDLVLALALVHHLSITNNVPFPGVAEYLSSLGQTAIVEFVGPEDKQVGRISANRRDDLSWYNRENFEAGFETCWNIREKIEISDSVRVIYLLRKKG